MKTNKTKKKSILRMCILHFTLFSVVVSVVFLITKQVSSSFFQNAMPVIDDVMKYEDELRAEDYSSIPMSKAKKSSFAVFDENDKMIYASSADANSNLSEDEIKFVSDTYNGVWFSVIKFDDDGEGNSGYAIIKTRYDENTKTDNIIDYCLVDDQYRIIRGDMFANREQLSEKEFQILSSGLLSNKKSIEKTSFVTNQGERRTLVFLSPAGNQKFYENARNRSTLIWFIMIPFLLIVILIETRIFVAHFKKIFRPMDDAVRDYENSRQFEIEPCDIPEELETFVYDFTELIDILNLEKNKNEEAYKEKQRVFANLSHDLRTPLTSIQGYSRAFIDGVVPEEKKIQYMQAIYDRVNDAVNIIDSVYEYSRLEHPDFQIELEKSDFCEFCKEYVAEKYSDLEFLGYVLEFNLPDRSFDLSFDKKLITRLFDNLIGNCIKYNEKGTSVYFVLLEKADSVEVTIADNGKGIPENVRENIFKPFVVGDEARTKMTGTGLGLTISKNVMNLHKGEIELVYPPKPPYSTQFKLTFRKS